MCLCRSMFCIVLIVWHHAIDVEFVITWFMAWIKHNNKNTYACLGYKNYLAILLLCRIFNEKHRFKYIGQENCLFQKMKLDHKKLKFVSKNGKMLYNKNIFISHQFKHLAQKHVSFQQWTAAVTSTSASLSNNN